MHGSYTEKVTYRIFKKVTSYLYIKKAELCYKAGGENRGGVGYHREMHGLQSHTGLSLLSPSF